MPKLFAECRGCGRMKHLETTRENRLRATICQRCGGSFKRTTRRAYLSRLRRLISERGGEAGRAQLELGRVLRDIKRQRAERRQAKARLEESAPGSRPASTEHVRGHPLLSREGRDPLDI